MAIRAVIGLGNPGASYAATRHNAGARWVALLAEHAGVVLTEQSKFKGRLARATLHGQDVRLLIPSTYMNLSGQAVGALATFFKLRSSEILVAHDEVAFAPGEIKLKSGGGHNGHNGLRDIVQALGNDNGFLRLRIGVGHPGHKSAVTAYLTSQTPPAAERELEAAAGARALAVLDDLLPGRLPQALNRLHIPA